jgi:hypothetical protein
VIRLLRIAVLGCGTIARQTSLTTFRQVGLMDLVRELAHNAGIWSGAAPDRGSLDRFAFFRYLR